MKELQSACTLVPMRARENEHEEFLSCQDEQVWKDLSEEWQQYLKEKEESPVIQDVFQQYDKSSRWPLG